MPSPPLRVRLLGVQGCMCGWSVAANLWPVYFVLGVSSATARRKGRSEDAVSAQKGPAPKSRPSTPPKHPCLKFTIDSSAFQVPMRD